MIVAWRSCSNSALQLTDKQGDRLAPVALLLQTYSRYPEGKHRCLEIMAEQGIALPDTPPMALHRGRIDLLGDHLRRDPQLLSRSFSHQEIFPLELGCHADESLALHGTPLAGASLLHMCVDYDEIEIARWMDCTRRECQRTSGSRCRWLRRAHGALRLRGVTGAYRCSRQTARWRLLLACC